MRLIRLKQFAAAVVMLGLAVSAAGAASKEAPKTESPEAAVKRILPDAPVSSVKKTDIEGFYEVVIGENVVYVHLKTGHIFAGNLFTREGKNLTAEVRSRLAADHNRLAAERIKLLTEEDKQKAVKVGSGKHEVIEVTDPDCPFCRKMHEYWAKRPDVTRYVFFLPPDMFSIYDSGESPRALAVG